MNKAASCWRKQFEPRVTGIEVESIKLDPSIVGPRMPIADLPAG